MALNAPLADHLPDLFLVPTTERHVKCMTRLLEMQSDAINVSRPDAIKRHKNSAGVEGVKERLVRWHHLKEVEHVEGEVEVRERRSACKDME